MDRGHEQGVLNSAVYRLHTLNNYIIRFTCYYNVHISGIFLTYITPAGLATALSNALARRSTSPADPPGSDFEELRMLRTLLQRATEKNK